MPETVGRGDVGALADRGDRAEYILRRLELTITRKLAGLLHGSYEGIVPGVGSEPGESRWYFPGDDVRRMDWPVTARTTVPHVRQTVADRELETWVVHDASPSLDLGTALMQKSELALAGLAAVVFLTVGGGNRIGALVAGTPDLVRIPAQAGTPAARVLLRRVAAQSERRARGGVPLAEALETLRRLPRRRGMAVVVSDFLGDDAWHEPLRALGALQDVLCIEIVDPRDLDLPDVGLLHLVDPETGAELEVQTSDASVRQRYAEAAAEQRARIQAGIRRAQAGHLQLSTHRDWLRDIVRFVSEERRRRVR